ncbi:MAG: DUF1043 family protein [Deltaproteobacteria bacterium]|nr:DUF1043 family protein [Deltaproteobacteria bacterium]MBW2360272.1 DUF1043 family protein [Deltaproteobacteria bacterium]
MPIEWNLTVLTALGVGLLVGVGLGLLFRGRSGAAERARAEQLDAELEQTREDLEAHRDDVARHFQETSDLFRGVTEQYSRLYAHLATGARAFSTDAVPMLGALETPLLGRTDGASAEAAAGSELEPEAEPAAPAVAEKQPTTGESAAREPAADAAPRVDLSPSVRSNGGLGASPLA